MRQKRQWDAMDVLVSVWRLVKEHAMVDVKAHANMIVQVDVRLDAEIHARIPAQDVAQEPVSNNCVLYKIIMKLM